MTPDVKAAIDSPAFSNACASRWCGIGVVSIYHRDSASPSGVRLVASTTEEDTEALEYLRVRHHTSPLFPTER